ncbi:MAG: hypothetical protein INR64_19435, partial [Caulobacteraceae bacterium]|nr:hypothetical protein [Caulobacter sp.]
MAALLDHADVSALLDLLASRHSDVEARELERAAAVETVLAPRAWTDARVESWVDGWGGRDASRPLWGVAHAWARRLADVGVRRGVLVGPRADRLADALERAALLGWLTPSRLAEGPAELQVVDLDDARGRGQLNAHVARCEAARLAAAAAPRLAERLDAVAQAVARCEGDR